MEILAFIGIILLIGLIYVGGGLLGWVLRGFGEIIGFLSKGWDSCFSVIVWIFLIILFIMALASGE